MARLWTIAVVAGVLMGYASPGLAQPAEASVLPSRSIPVELAWLSPDFSAFMVLAGADLAELQRWVNGFKEWQEWSSRWRNQREPGWLTTYRDRRQKPSPPAWLPARCESVEDEAEPLSTACTLLTMWGARRSRVASAAHRRPSSDWPRSARRTPPGGSISTWT